VLKELEPSYSSYNVKNTVNTMRRALLVLLTLSAVWGCRQPQDSVDNLAPETTMSVDSIQRSGDLRLNANVHLNWYGSDADGYIDYFNVQVNDGPVGQTTATDSIFTFVIDAGLDSADVLIKVSAVDHLGLEDPTPAQLWVPLKNAAPTCRIDSDGLEPDSAKIVVTLRWDAEDIDGDETIVEAEVRLNNGPWSAIDLGQGLLSFAMRPDGQSAALYQNGFLIDSALAGALVNDENTIYLRVRDWAGSYSEVDTSAAFYWSGRDAAMLVLNSQPAYIGAQYKGWLDAVGDAYDYVQMDAITGIGIPSYWNPTMRLLFEQYDRVLLFADATQFPNNGGTDFLLNILAPSVQSYVQGGGKVFTSAQLTSSMDMTAINDVYPISGSVTSTGQARLTNDSAMVPVDTASGAPSLRPQNIVLGVTPVVPAADANSYYEAQLTKIAGWTGDGTVGAVRSRNGEVFEIFFSVPIHQFSRTDSPNGGDLLKHVLDNEF
jgi:hypothetical protein